MKILVINCGSSTLKFKLLALQTGGASVKEKRLAGGIVDKIGGRASIKFRAKQELQETRAVSDHGQASRLVLDWLAFSKLLEDRLDAVGHRVIHGGDQFSQPVLIDEEVINAIAGSSELAPLHNQPSLRAIRAMRERLGAEIPMVAVFDTAFHHTLPEIARRYAIPPELADKHHVRRYGFHGLAHRYMMERYATITNTPREQVKLITLQLGNGCSATAIAGGRSVDTSMGLTPLEGLIMGSRSGDVDPTLASFLAQREGVDVETAEDWLNTKSGLLGVSGRSRDMRELLDAEDKGDKMARLAIDMFCYRLKKYIGAYLATLDGADAVIFGGGIGENAPEVRQRILAGMDWLGLKLDNARNNATVGSEGRISADDTRVHAYVIPVDEALIIARDTFSLLKKTAP
ncbi:MAG: acetate kinase [Dehalococcoidia bacterium]|nr:MAG: acetate kinase [Dehalococcoidia bacterium]